MTSLAPRRSIAVALVLAGLAVASPAFAGPPLLCHPFQIGNARSLPWDGRSSWYEGKADYKLSNLVADTKSILVASTPVIVRMETLRRAAIYASRDREVAAALLAALSARTHEARADAPGYLDLAYVVGAFRQIGGLDRPGSPFAGRSADLLSLVRGLDPYALVQKGLFLRPGDSSFEFAAAIISMDGHRASYDEHLQRARKGIQSDPLLALNLREYLAER